MEKETSAGLIAVAGGLLTTLATWIGYIVIAGLIIWGIGVVWEKIEERKKEK